MRIVDVSELTLYMWSSLLDWFLLCDQRAETIAKCFETAPCEPKTHDHQVWSLPHVVLDNWLHEVSGCLFLFWQSVIC
jgi:hypothetical protein